MLFWVIIHLRVCLCVHMHFLFLCICVCVYMCVCVCVCVGMCAPTEFFDLISKAQSNRADDQRGLLNKSDLQLPDFLRLSPVATNQSAPPLFDPEPSCSTPNSRNPNNGSFPSSGRRGNKTNSNDRGGGGGGTHLLSASHQSQSLDSALGTENGGGRKSRPLPPFPGTVSPIHPSSSRGESVQMLEEDTLSDLTLVGEGDINSPSLNYITPSALPCKPQPQQQAQDSRPSSGTFPVWHVWTFPSLFTWLRAELENPLTSGWSCLLVCGWTAHNASWSPPSLYLARTSFNSTHHFLHSNANLRLRCK